MSLLPLSKKRTYDESFDNSVGDVTIDINKQITKKPRLSVIHSSQSKIGTIDKTAVNKMSFLSFIHTN